MSSGKGWDERKDIDFGNDWDHGKMLRYYIYHNMKKEGFHVVADIFANDLICLKLHLHCLWTEKHRHVKILFKKWKMDTLSIDSFILDQEFKIKVLDSNKGLLKEWWKLLWPQLSSRLANETPENSQSFEQPSMQDVLPILASQGATSSQHAPVRNPQHIVVPTPVTNQQMIASGGSAGVNFVEQPAASWLQTPPVVRQCRAGKRPVNTNTESILRKSPTPSLRPSNLHLPVTMQSPLQLTWVPSNNAVVERPDQMDSNRLGQISACPPPGHQAGLSDFLSKFLKE